MKYFLELWIRDEPKEALRALSSQDPETYWPHVTLVRPFHLYGTHEEIERQELEVQKEVQKIGKKIGAVTYSLEGEATLQGNANVIPVTNHTQLRRLDNALEMGLESLVNFVDKIEDPKKLHVTVDYDKPLQPVEKIDNVGLWITALKKVNDHSIIAFSYDLVVDRLLDREQSLKPSIWKGTKLVYSDRRNLSKIR